MNGSEKMIKYLENQEKKETKDLWREAFPEDSEEFLDYYDQKKMKGNQVLVRMEQGCIQSMLHLNPYHLQVRELCWDVNYIVAVATRADMRHRGYMRSLLTRAMEDMRREGQPFCFLMPAAEAIYTPFQFAFIYDQPIWRLKEDMPLKRTSIEGKEQVGQAAEWMQNWMKQRYEIFARRDEAYVDSLICEVKSEDGSLDLLYNEDLLVGIQGIWGREKKEQRLLYTEDHYAELTERKPAIMARIITPETFVQVVRLKPEVQTEAMEICLELEDPWILQNNGRFIWTLDHAGSRLEKTNPAAERAEAESSELREKAGEVLHLRIEELTQWLFGYRVPIAAEQYAGAEQLDMPDRIFLDEVV